MTDTLEVRDDNRRLVFHGSLLAQSSSRESYDKGRWVEFELYVTENGGYVLSRIGQTRYVHAFDCKVADRNRLAPMGLDEVGSLDGLFECEECYIDLDEDDEFKPEVPRFWAMKFYTPDDVVDALHKKDKNGNLYLTNVARDLLEDAAEVDDGIDEAYYIDVID